MSDNFEMIFQVECGQVGIRSADLLLNILEINFNPVFLIDLDDKKI